MPKPVHKPKSELDAAIRERADFESGFRKSSNGNPTRTWEGLRLTVFGRDSEYSWVCSDDDEPTYSPEKYETQHDAIAGLADYLDVGRL